MILNPSSHLVDDSTRSTDSKEKNDIKPTTPEWFDLHLETILFFSDLYKEIGGISPQLIAALVKKNPLQFYYIFLNTKIWYLMVNQTNLYANNEDLESGMFIKKSFYFV